MRKRVTYRPSKAQGVFGVIYGGIFVLIGLLVAIPFFGPFGVLWTLVAVGITAMNAYQAFGKKYAGPEISIEEDGPEQAPCSSPAPPQAHDHIPSTALDAKGRLEQLETLRGAGLITDQEYRQKRQEILKGI